MPHSVSQAISALGIDTLRARYANVRAAFEPTFIGNPISPKHETATPDVVGLVVDYATALRVGVAPERVMAVAVRGAKRLAALGCAEPSELASTWLATIADAEGVPTDDALRAVANLSRLDDAGRGHLPDVESVNLERPRLNAHTCGHIRQMVGFATDALERPVECEVSCGNDIDARNVGSAAADFLSDGGTRLVEMKCVCGSYDTQASLQVIAYLLLGRHQGLFNDVNRVALINPRRCESWDAKLPTLPFEDVSNIGVDVCGYRRDLADELADNVVNGTALSEVGNHVASKRRVYDEHMARIHALRDALEANGG